MNDDLKPIFNELSTAIKELHKDLLMREAKKLENEIGKPITPYELLHASLNDPNLAWLRRLSSMIVNIDTLIDEVPQLSAQDSNRVAAEVLNILEKPPGLIDTDFWSHYSQYLGHEADIIMRHAKIKEILTRLKPMT